MARHAADVQEDAVAVEETAIPIQRQIADEEQG